MPACSLPASYCTECTSGISPGVAAADDQEPVPGQPAARLGGGRKDPPPLAPSLITWRVPSDAIISTVLEIIFLVNGERKTVPSDKMSITTDITMRTRGTFARLIRQSLSSD